MRNQFIAILVLGLLSCEMTTPSEKVVVYTSKGNTQCNLDGLGSNESEQVLVNAGIDVIKTMCGYQSGIAHSAVCGGSTSDIIAHEIVGADLELAMKYGYQNISNLVDQDHMIGYEINECTDVEQ